MQKAQLRYDREQKKAEQEAGNQEIL